MAPSEVIVSADRGDLQTRRHERRVSLLGQRHSILGHPSGFLFTAFVSSQPHVARFPASECGTCFGLPDSLRLWPLAPSAPQGVAACCSQISQLLWPHLTSLNFTSLASSYLCFPLRPCALGQHPGGSSVNRLVVGIRVMTLRLSSCRY